MLRTTHPAPFLEGDQAIGWAIDRNHGDPRVFFGGRAPGFTSSMMFDPKARRGAVVLSNSALMVESLGRVAQDRRRRRLAHRPIFRSRCASD